MNSCGVPQSHTYTSHPLQGGWVDLVWTSRITTILRQPLLVVCGLPNLKDNINNCVGSQSRVASIAQAFSPRVLITCVAGRYFGTSFPICSFTTKMKFQQTTIVRIDFIIHFIFFTDRMYKYFIYKVKIFVFNFIMFIFQKNSL